MEKIGRNELCPCGSGRKYKYCCLRHLQSKAARRPDCAAVSGNAGVALFEEGKFDEAIVQFRNALSCAPDSAAAHNNLGNALVIRGDLDEGLACLREAVAIDPGHAIAHNNLGNALRQQGRPAESIASYRNALNLLPGNPAIHANLGIALSDFGKVEQAAEAFRDAIRLDPGFAEAHNSLGVALLELGKLGAAVASVEKALALRPDFAEALFNLHSLLLDTGEPLEATRCLEKVVALRPGDAVARSYLGVLLDHCGDLRRAAEHFERAAAGSAAARAIVDGYRYINSFTGTRPLLTGCPHTGIRIGLEASIAEGLVLEFGVRFGVSTRQIAALAGQEVHGFDSFEGLPEAWHLEPRGSYTTVGEMPAVPGNVFLHKGWFEDTLPRFKEAHDGPVRFMHIDCDIYSSTRAVLEIMADRIAAGTVIAFDEYFGHSHWRQDEFRAFQEAVARYDWRYEYLSFSTKQAVVRVL